MRFRWTSAGAVGAAFLQFPAGKQREKMSDSGEVQSRIAHQAQKSVDPVKVHSREVAGPFFGLNRDQQAFSLVQAQKIDRDFKFAGDCADLDQSVCVLSLPS